jgi:serine/threonine protein kinase
MQQNTFVQIRCRNGSLAGHAYCYIEPGLLPIPTPLRIGRHQDAHIRFAGEAEQMVDHLHAELRYDQGVVSLRDVGSRQGTFVFPTRQKIDRLRIAQGTSYDVQLGADGPVCNISLGSAVPFGRYMLTNKLGEGGMGEVYIGCDTRLTRQVVLKLLHRSVLDQATVLVNEARIVSQIEHPNIVRVYEIGDQDGVLYLAMEYIRGVTLNELRRALAKAGKRMPPALAAGIMRQACLGLHAAHQLPIQIVHRDVSPNNVMMTPESVKVIDFGVARAKNRVGASFSEGGRVTGCPPYMSPEQIGAAQTVDRRSDIFSVGTVLYQLCTEVSPFERDNTAATLAAVMMYHPPPLRSLCPQASEGLERLVRAMLCKDPRGRPATAGEVAALLRDEAGAEFAGHEHLFAYLQGLGIDLQGPIPQPLVEEPVLLRRTQQRQALPAPTPSTGLPLPELVGRRIADGRYLLRAPLGDRAPAPEQRVWEQTFLAERTRADGEVEAVVVTVCGGRERQHALPEREALRLHDYLAHRRGPGQCASLPAVCDHGSAWPQGPIYFVTPHAPRLLAQIERTTLQPADALKIALQIGRALGSEARWHAGYAHGRIHPDHIGITHDGEAGLQATLLGFPWRFVLDPEEPAAAPAAAPAAPTPYLAPELWQQGAPTPAADVFALGMLLYGLCGGDPAAARQCLQDELDLPSLPSAAQTSLSPDALAVLFDSLRLDPAMRPTLAELMEILRTGSSAASSAGAAAPTDNRAALPGPVAASADAEARPPLFLLEDRSATRVLPFGRQGRLHVSTLCIRAQDFREPVPVPLDLGGLLAGVSQPLLLDLGVNALELRVCAQAITAGRAVRIYSTVMSAAARTTHVLLPNLCEVPLYIGHHRGPLYSVHVSSRSRELVRAARLRAALPRLKLEVEAPAGARSLLTLWRAAPQTHEVHLACVVVKADQREGD